MNNQKNSNLFGANNVIKNSLWSLSERILAQVVSFVISVILARLLLPNDYGVVALIQIFINLISLIFDKGLTSALNQKKHPDKEDYYSVITFGLIVSLALYAFLCYFAPIISNYFSKYDATLLTSLIRVMGISIPISAINVVEKSFISKRMLFKKFFWATFSGTVISGVVGILMAYKGFGAFSLVAQRLINLSIDTIILAFVIKRPILAMVDFLRIKSMLKYGWKVIASSILTTLTDSLRSSVIAKTFSPDDLAHYNKGESLPKIIMGTIDVSVANVLFVTMSDSQDDLVHLKKIVRKFVKLASYVIFPMLIGLFSISDSLVPILFGSQWIPTIPYLKIFCIIYLTYPLQDAALLSIRAIKKSGVTLIMDIVSQIVIVSLLFALVPLGPLYITIGYMVGIFVTVIIGMIMMRKYINYKFYELLFDLLKNIIITGLMFVSVYFLKYIPINKGIVMITQVIVGILSYLVFSKIFKSNEFTYLLSFVKNNFKRKTTH